MIEQKSEQIDIKSLTLTESMRKPGVVDPVTYFSETDWEEARSLMESPGLFGHGFFLLLPQINPSLLDEFRESKGKINSQFDNFTQSIKAPVKNWEKMCLLGAELKTIDPERFAALRFPKRAFDRALSKLDRELTDRNAWGSMIPPAFYPLGLAVVFPQYREETAASNNIANSVKAEFDYSLQAEEWDVFVSSAAAMRILMPDVFEENRSKIVQALEERMDIKHLMSYNDLLDRPARIYDKVFSAAHLRMLLAEEIQLTSRGIRLKMPEVKKDLKPESLPKRRNF